jgi:DNA repair protein RecO
MSRQSSDAIIYKLHRYSDSSAVAKAFTLDHGRIKLFIPKAFSKKGGILTCFPCNIDFHMKENSDLCKFYTFTPKPQYYHFINSHEIVIRLHYLFEIFDGLYEEREKDSYLMRLIMKIDDENFRKAVSFTVRHMFERNGVLPDFSNCTSCGETENHDGYIVGGEFFCRKCRSAGINVTNAVYTFMQCAQDNALMKTHEVSRENEIEIIKFFSFYYKSLYAKELKSTQTLLSLI